MNLNIDYFPGVPVCGSCIDRLSDKVSEMGILIVDCDQLFCESLADYLHVQGFENLFMATTCDGMLDLLEEELIDLVLSDVGMPGMNGDSLTEVMRYNSDLTFSSLFLTHDSSAVDEVMGCVSSTVCEGVLKPVNFELLGLRVRACLECAHSSVAKKAK